MSSPHRRPAAHHARTVKHWVPRGALVVLMLTIALVAIFVMVRPGWFQGPFREGPPSELAFTKSLADLGHPDGIRLSDDNSISRSVTAPLPLDAHVDSAHLKLAGRTQVGESSTVFLRVLADGEAVYVAELSAGTHDFVADVVLPAGILNDGGVTLQMRLTGSLEDGICSVTDELGALVLLDPHQTRVEATLYQRVYSVRDAVAALSRDVTLELATPDGDRGWFETAARLGVALTQRGYRVTYNASAESAPQDWRNRILLGPAEQLTGLGWTATEDSGSSTWQVGHVGDVAVLAVVEPSTEVPAPLMPSDVVAIADAATNASQVDADPPTGDVVSLAALGIDAEVQRITDRRVWRLPYSLIALPGGRVPRELLLQLAVPVVAEDSRWMVQIQLNGQLLDSVRLPGGSATQSVSVPIPQGIEMLRNDLTVTLLRDRLVTGCTVRYPSYEVQLLPTSSLVLGGPGAGFTAVPSEFANGFDVIVPSSGADDPSATLAALVPTLSQFGTWSQQPPFVWDGVPSGRPFFLLGNAPDGVDVPVRLVDGRLVAAGFDLQAFENGLVVERAAAGEARGLVVIPVGRPVGDPAPYGREVARLVTGRGDGVVVSDSGRIVLAPPDGQR